MLLDANVYPSHFTQKRQKTVSLAPQVSPFTSAPYSPPNYIQCCHLVLYINVFHITYYIMSAEDSSDSGVVLSQVYLRICPLSLCLFPNVSQVHCLKDRCAQLKDLVKKLRTVKLKRAVVSDFVFDPRQCYSCN